MFTRLGEESGRSMVLHGVSPFPRRLGHTTAWDNGTYAFIQDVVDGKVVSVPLTVDRFARTNDVIYTNVPATEARLVELWAVEPDAELLGPFADGDANVKHQANPYQVSHVCSSQVPTHRYQPSAHSARAIYGSLGRHRGGRNNRRLPRTRELDHTGRCPTRSRTPFTRLPSSSTSAPSRRGVPPSPSLLRQPPGLAAPPHVPGGDANDIHLTRLVVQMAEEHRLTREDVRERHEAARAPNHPSSYWGEASCQSLSLICNVDAEDELPEL
jgi:hypothetical protein